MTEAKRAVRPASSARPAPSTAAHPPRDASGVMYWLVLQGDVVDLVTSPTAPDLTTLPGERRKRLMVGTKDKGLADKKLAELKARARGVAGRGEAY